MDGLLVGLLRFFVEISSCSWEDTSVSSNTTVAFPPIPSPRRIEGVRFKVARFGAQIDKQVVSKDGFLMFLVLGDSGAWFVFTARGMRTAEPTTAGIFGC